MTEQEAENLQHIYHWFRILGGLQRKGWPCRVLKEGRLNSCLVEFADGFQVVTSRRAVRRKGPEKNDQHSDRLL